MVKIKILLGALLVASLAAAAGLRWRSTAAEPLPFREAVVQRDELVVSLGATGTLEPEEVVDVGAQVAGIIREFGQEPGSSRLIDYGSQVEPGTVLARIDDAVYREEVQLARAELAQARAQHQQAQSQVRHAAANVQRAEADLVQQRTKYDQAERDSQRGRLLSASRALAQQEVENLQSIAEQTEAQVGTARAALAQASAALETARSSVVEGEARVERAEALLRKAETNLGYTTIRSPIRGRIIDRRVNVGQTVVASLNAPSLFLIAKDLKRLQIWASVNEADIGQIRPGQPVRFTVDAFPDEVFRGEVSQVRLNATMTQNVVTYTVVVTVENPEGRLLPYLTANLQFEIVRRPNVLVVPSSALRWQPRPEQIAPEHGSAAPRPGSPRTASTGKNSGASNQGTLWVAQGSSVRPIAVQVGASDGLRTEVSGPEVVEGLRVVVGQARTGTGSPGTSNPFTPQFFTPKKSSE
jgi:HlyD family secretion protein